MSSLNIDARLRRVEAMIKRLAGTLDVATFDRIYELSQTYQQYAAQGQAQSHEALALLQEIERLKNL